MIPGNAEGSWEYKWMFVEPEGIDRQNRRQPDAKKPGRNASWCPVVALPFSLYPFSKLVLIFMINWLSCVRFQFTYNGELIFHGKYPSINFREIRKY